MTKRRDFGIGVVLSVTTGRLLCDFADLHEFIEFMVGGPVFTHQLVKASDYIKPFILAAHPQLESVDASAVNEANWQAWLDQQIAALGPTLSLSLVGTDQFSDPIGDAIDMFGKDRVAVVRQ